MVAETHTHHDRIDPDDVLALLAGHVNIIDPAQTTLADCGFDGDLGIVELAELLAEEYGERALSPFDLDDLDDHMTLAALIDRLERGS